MIRYDFLFAYLFRSFVACNVLLLMGQKEAYATVFTPELLQSTVFSFLQSTQSFIFSSISSRIERAIKIKIEFYYVVRPSVHGKVYISNR